MIFPPALYSDLASSHVNQGSIVLSHASPVFQMKLKIEVSCLDKIGDKTVDALGHHNETIISIDSVLLEQSVSYGK